ncbi:hypothetical protein J3Q64DRAFT_1747760 [Phycomyces blakesleeanus]|uniref:Uncharacterized protein n=1 Tax=Phycomyces blakesleeanus TaxID=4837 RepID=A0ABR3AXL7_PHYBL
MCPFFSIFFFCFQYISSSFHIYSFLSFDKITIITIIIILILITATTIIPNS